MRDLPPECSGCAAAGESLDADAIWKPVPAKQQHGHVGRRTESNASRGQPGARRQGEAHRPAVRLRARSARGEKTRPELLKGLEARVGIEQVAYHFDILANLRA